MCVLVYIPSKVQWVQIRFPAWTIIMAYGCEGEGRPPCGRRHFPCLLCFRFVLTLPLYSFVAPVLFCTENCGMRGSLRVMLCGEDEACYST